MDKDINFATSDLQRRASNFVKRGRVVELDYKKTPPRVKVEFEKDSQTDWLPFLNAGSSKKGLNSWAGYAVGEQVLVICEGGDPALGVVMGSLHDKTTPPPSTKPNEFVKQFSDDTVLKYDTDSHVLTVELCSGATLDIVADTVNVKGDIKASGEISDKKRSMDEDRKIFNDHIHPAPNGNTGKPATQM